MTQMMKKLFALLMAVMMLCASLPLDALAELVPSAPIEEHSQSAWMYSALGDVAPISLDDSMDDHITAVPGEQNEDVEFDEGYKGSDVRILIDNEVYNGSLEGKTVGVHKSVTFTIEVAHISGHEDLFINGSVTFSLNNGGDESIVPKESKQYTVVENVNNIDVGKFCATNYTYEVQPEDVYVNATIDWNEDPIEISIPVAHDMNLEVEKSVTDGPANGVAYQLGEEIPYTITVTNKSQVYVKDITVTDEMLKKTWTIDRLEGSITGEYNSDTIDSTEAFYEVQEDDILEGYVKNVATATGSDPYGEDNVNGENDETVPTVTAAPALTAELSASPDSGADLGEEITYTITVTNIGNLTVDEIKAEDTLNGEYDAIGPLDPKKYHEEKGAEYSVSEVHKVTEADILAGEIYTTATVKGTASNGDEMNPYCEPVTVTLAEPAPVLTVVNSADKPSGAALGEEITYTVTVTNTGNLTVKDITVTDLKNGLNETIETLAPGESKEYTTTHTITEEDILAGSYVNTATATGTAPDPDNTATTKEVTGSDEETVTTEDQKPALTVSKTADKTSDVAVNAEINYTINVKNDGNVTVKDITVTDPLTGLNDYNVGTLAPGASKEDIKTTYTVKQDDVDAGSVTNIATATGSDPNSGEVKGSDDETVTMEDAAPALTVENKASKTEGATLDEEITYTITVTNTGNVTVSGIKVNDEKTGLKDADVGTLAPDASASVTTKHTITEDDILAGSFVNTATATGTPARGTGVTGTGTATVNTVAKNPKLTVTKTADKTSNAALGEEITYTITVKNDGNVTVSNITVTDPLTGLNQSIDGSLAPGASSTGLKTTYTVQEKDILADSFENTATASGKDPKGEPVTGDGKATVTTATAAPALTVAMTANPTEDADLNDVITYTITVTNSGNVTVNDIKVSDPLTGSKEVALNPATLAPGAHGTAEVTYTVTEADILNGSFVNIATATGTGANGGEVSKSADVTVNTAAQAPALTVEKTADKTTGAALGEEITYTITVTNSGNVTVSDIAVTDGKTGLEESVDTLAPKASTSVTTTHTITEDDILAGSFVNTATAKGKNPNGGEVTGSDNETVTTAAQAPALTVEMTADPTEDADLGDEITYTITVTNSGNVTVSDITVTDKAGSSQSVGTLAPGASTSVTTKHTITAEDIEEGSFKNTATATGTAGSKEVSNSDDETVTTVAKNPAWTVTKTMSGASGEDGKAVVGDELTYTVTVKNTGNINLTGKTLTDEFKVDDVVQSEALTWAEGSDPTQPFDLTPGNTKTFTATYTVQATDNNLSNTATVGDETDGHTKTVSTEVKGEDAWTVTKTMSGASGEDGAAKVGDELTYTVTVENTGNTDLSDLTLTDNFSVDGVVNNEALTWTAGNPSESFNLAQGAKKIFTATYTVQASDNTLSNTAKTDEAHSTTIPTTVENEDAWTVEKSVSGATGTDGKAVVGNVLTYTVTVTNIGNTNLSGLTLTDEFSVDGVVNNGALNWTDGNPTQAFGLAQGETKTFAATYTVQATDNELSNTAKVGDKSGKAETTVEGKDAWTVTKTVEGASGTDGKAIVGDKLTYKVTVENTGNTGLTGLKLEDSFGVDGVVSNDKLTWAEGSDPTQTFDLAKGATQTFTATYTVQATDNNLSNTATVGDEHDEETTTVEDKDAWTVEKTVSGASGAEGAAKVGEVLTYTVTVTNTGNTALSDLKLEDEFNVDGVVSNEALKWAEGSDPTQTFGLAQGESKTFTATYTVQATDNELSNTAKVGDQSDKEETTVNDTPAWTVEKTASVESVELTEGQKVNVGDEITYTVTVKNTGNTSITKSLSDVFTVDGEPQTLSLQKDGEAYDGGNFTLAEGATATFTATYTVQASDNTLSNTATVDGQSKDVTTMVEGKDAWTVTKTVSGTSGEDGAAKVGDELTYTVTVENTGNTDLNDLTLTDEFSVDGVVNNDALTWTENKPNEAFDLAQGAKKVFKATYTVQATDNSLSNTATVGGEHDDETTTVEGKDAWTVEKSMAITKAEGNKRTGQVEVGDTLTYTVTVKNTGNTDLTGKTLTDEFTVDGKTGALTWTGENPTEEGYTFDLKKGATKTFTATYTVQGTDKKLSNTAKVGDEASSPITTEVVDKPGLTVEKTAASKSNAALGAVITYTITVTNSGNVTVSNITVTDPLTGLEKNVGTLESGASAEAITTTYTVTEADILVGSFVNTATATGKDPNGGEVTGEGKVTVTTVVAAAALTVEVSANKADHDEQLGEIVTYTITVTNSGNVTVNGINVTDPLTGLNQSVGTLAPGESAEAITTTYTVTEDDIIAGHITNTVTATGTGANGGEVSGTGDVTVRTVDADPELTVVKRANKTSGAKLNDVITYTITVTNSGNETVNHITVADPLTGLNRSVGSLAPGRYASMTTTHTITEADILAGSVVNTATATGTDPNRRTVTDSGSATVRTAEAAPALTVEKTADKTEGVDLNDVITYVIKVTNSGNVTVSGIAVTDPLTGLEQSVGTLAPGESAEAITTSYTVTEDDIIAGHITNTVTATGTDPKDGEVSGSDEATVTTAAQNPAWTVAKSVSGATGADGKAAVGDALTYTVTVENTGNTTLTGLKLEDEFCVDEVVQNDALTWTGDDPAEAFSLAPGTEKTFTATYTVQATDNSLSNTAKVGSETSEKIETPVEGKDAWTVEKTVTGMNGADGRATVGDVLTYAVTVENTGNTDLTGKTLTDEFSVNGAVKSDALTWTEGDPAEAFDLAQGATKTFTATYTVQATDQELSNTAEVGGRKATIATVVEPKKAYEARKTVEGANGADGLVEVGSALNYTITVRNTGNAELSVELKDIFNGEQYDLSGATISGGTLVGDALTVAYGDTAVIAYSYTVQPTDVALNNGITVDGDAPAGGEGDTTVTVVPKEAYEARKTVSGLIAEGESAGQAAVGDVLTYTIAVENKGNTVLNGLAVSDALNDAPVDLSGAELGKPEGSGATFDGTTLSGVGVGETVTLTYTYTVQATDSVLANAATVGDKTAETTTAVTDNPSVGITKTVTGAPANGTGYELGETIAYNVVVTNDGNLELHDVKVTDPLTGMDEELASLLPGASVTLNTSHVVTEADLLGANGYGSVTELELDDEGGISTPRDPEPSGLLANTATVEGVASNHAKVAATSSAEAPIADVTTGVSVAMIAKLDGAQIPENAEVPVGSVIEYEITVTNNGNVTTEQTIRDVLTLNGDEATKQELTLTPGGVLPAIILIRSRFRRSSPGCSPQATRCSRPIRRCSTW